MQELIADKAGVVPVVPEGPGIVSSTAEQDALEGLDWGPRKEGVGQSGFSVIGAEVEPEVLFRVLSGVTAVDSYSSWFMGGILRI